MATDRSRRLLEASFDSIPIGVIVQDLEGRIVASNRPARLAIGMESDELHGRGSTDEHWSIVDRDGVPVPDTEYPPMVALRTGRAVIGQRLGLRRGGSTTWSTVDGVPLFDDDGAIEAVATYFRDANGEVRSEARRHELLNEMRDGYASLDESGRITFVNRAAQEILGRTAEQLVGADLFDQFPSMRGTEFQVQFDSAADGGSTTFQEYLPDRGCWLEVRGHAVPGGVVAYFSDVTEQRRAEEERLELVRASELAHRHLVRAATRDALTGLFNRASLEDWITQRVERPDPDRVAVVFIDLDHFKRVNDTLGHAEGDGLLVRVAQRLQEIVRPGDAVARLGGDEFVIAIEAPTDADAYRLAQRVLSELRRPTTSGGRRLVVTPSMGIAFSGPGATTETLLRDADAALYQAKDAGRNRCETFDDRVRRAVEERFEIETELHEVVQRDELRAWYQPMFDARSGDAVGVEMLARWDHPERGTLGAGDFIPVAEESGAIVAIGDRMLQLATGDLDRLVGSLESPNARVWINVSVRQLDEPGYTSRLHEYLSAHGLLGSIGIEVTETAFARDEFGTAEQLRQLAHAGVPIAIDDFGTGYSSLARLIDFPVDVLKIDQAFVQGIFHGRTVSAVKAIVDLASAIGAKSCAEGIENDAQLRCMLELGVDLLSGYHLGPPVTPDGLAASLAQSSAVIDGVVEPLVHH